MASQEKLAQGASIDLLTERVKSAPIGPVRAAEGKTVASVMRSAKLAIETLRARAKE